MIVAALIAGTLMQATQAPAPAHPPSSDLPVSIEHIRAALERPDKLTLDPITPDFVVDVRERQRFEQRVPQWDFKSGPVPPGGLYFYEQLQRAGLSSAQPLFLVDLIAIGRGLASAHAAHSASVAREDVRRAIAEYCAARPDGGAGIAICVK
jgi:hypothetical protein